MGFDPSRNCKPKTNNKPMTTIQQQLSQINEFAQQIVKNVNDYQAGFITMNEMTVQVYFMTLEITKAKVSICNEYGINETAVDLMLNMNF
jgi:hypothetical protein